MEFRGKKLLRLLTEHDPSSPEFRSGVRDVLHPSPVATAGEFDLWRDVFVEQELPWRRFLQSALLHGTAVALIWTISASWIRQQKILDRATFDRASLVTYTPEEYLPPLDTGTPKALKAQKGDPAFAKQPILSVPPEADNRSQTIVAPPDLKLNRDVPMPNIVAAGAITPSVPLDATRAPLARTVAPEMQVVAPAPEVQFAPDRVVRTAMKSDVIAPPPELSPAPKGHVSLMNIGPSDVVAPAPRLALEEQHAPASHDKGRLSGGMQPVGPPPSMAAASGASGNGRLIALGIHPVAPTGPVAVPSGNRRGTFAADPHGKPGASGTPDLAQGSGKDTGVNGHNKGSLPTGLQVGAKDPSASSGREMASLSTAPTKPGARDGSAVSNDKLTDLDRQVFGEKVVHTMALNMPNLNSSTGSWVIKFAELDPGKKQGQLMAPDLPEKSDPGYPLELMRANVQGKVTLYAIIQADGRVGSVRVLNSPDERLDPYAAKALARCVFSPAVRNGKPVALEAVVEIPFRVVRKNF